MTVTKKKKKGTPTAGELIWYKMNSEKIAGYRKKIEEALAQDIEAIDPGAVAVVKSWGIDKLIGEAILGRVIITPNMAAYIIKNYNTNNRGIKWKSVSFFVDLMLNNLMEITHQGVAFSKGPKPDLMDGQHRLYAAIISGCSFSVLVMAGYEDRTRFAVDSGTGRSITDHETIRGRFAKPQWAVSILRAIDNLMNPCGPTSDHVINELGARYADALDWLYKMTEDEVVTPKKLARNPRVLAALVVSYTAHPKETSEYAKTLLTGVCNDPNHPALLARSEVLDNRDKLDTVYKAILRQFNALNAYITKQEPVTRGDSCRLQPCDDLRSQFLKDVAEKFLAEKNK